ncbi:H(+)-transporting V0 sector ATPase subunit e [Cryptotrichosporon argae]
MSFFHVVIVGIVVAGIAAGVWFAAPRGKNQTLIRSSVSLALTCCYLMWAVTYLAQLHPLIAPRRSDLRAEY